jgi:hypothetical protein
MTLMTFHIWKRLTVIIVDSVSGNANSMVLIIKCAKCMRDVDAVRGVTLLRSVRMRECIYNFSAHFSRAGRTHRILLTIVNTVTQPV